ncbi:MAG: YcxB family protein [Chitinophagales bacterium]
MKLTFEITRQDYSGFVRYLFYKRRFKRTAFMILIVLIAVQFSINYKNPSWYSVFISSVVSLAIYAFLINRGLNRAGNIPDENGSILGHREMEFLDDRFTCNSEKVESSNKYSTIKSVEESSLGFYLFVDKNVAMLVPKRAFANKTQEDDFRKLITSQLSKPI